MTLLKTNKLINLKGKLYSFEYPKVMGILNLSPDSFYDGGSWLNVERAVSHALQMHEDGAFLIDIGAFTSKPGSSMISENEEENRLFPVLELLNKKNSEIIISVDTCRAGIAKKVVNRYDVAIINDISCGNFDPDMFECIAQLKVPYVLMHIQGSPLNMQVKPIYQNVVKEVVKTLSEKISHLNRLGVNDIIIDPGFGFGKSIENNFELLRNLEYFHLFEKILLVGISRKSMIYKTLNVAPSDALCGTISLNMVALMKGANIIRVHDVKEAVQTVTIFQKLYPTKIETDCYTY